ncbi:MAG: threonine--tRNA ligase [Planctomycetes bacterium]|nr:threonine--tRNA ligase [Planctomycetota bacterium]
MPDGHVLELAEGAATYDVALAIGAGLARAAIAGKVTCNGHSEIIDLNRPLPGDCQISILTTDDANADSLFVLRHSTAHVMAEAICKLFPDAQLVYGPPVEDGFYYDIDLPQSLTPDDFPRIEEEMSRIIKEKRTFCRVEMSREEGLAKVRKEGSRYKIDNAERAEGDALSFYVTGDRPGEHFEDLCRGPHIPSTTVIKAFKIRQVSRSHYRGDVNDQPLQRVYGTAFFKKASLQEFFTQLEEARKRDHRVLGKELDLFHMSDQVGSGLPLWLPKGTIVRTELQKYLTEEMVKLGYELVVTPHIGQLGLYRTSGHYPYYEDSQFPAMFETARGKAIQGALQIVRKILTLHGEEADKARADLADFLASVEKVTSPIEGLDEALPTDKLIETLYTALASEPGYLLKPMNCPHHIQIYASRPRSYRDLPVRIAEYGTVYRFEQSGELSGLTRVRGFTQDDAHLFCTADQLADELQATVTLTRGVLDILGMSDYRVRLGMGERNSDKYVGSTENWIKAEDAIRTAAVASGIEYTEEVGEAAFYGPKIDFVVKDCIGRSWQLGTVQVDYNLPERFDLSYIGSDNAQHRPIMIHRAPFGSMERFVGILIEHFAGAFPMWLSPVQVAVATVSEKSQAYARVVYERLKAAGLRTELDLTDDKIGPKKHRHRAAKVNYILVVGEQEAADSTVNVNDRDGKTLGNMAIEVFENACRREIDSKGAARVGNNG